MTLKNDRVEQECVIVVSLLPLVVATVVILIPVPTVTQRTHSSRNLPKTFYRSTKSAKMYMYTLKLVRPQLKKES